MDSSFSQDRAQSRHSRSLSRISKGTHEQFSHVTGPCSPSRDWGKSVFMPLSSKLNRSERPSDSSFSKSCLQLLPSGARPFSTPALRCLWSHPSTLGMEISAVSDFCPDVKYTPFAVSWAKPGLQRSCLSDLRPFLPLTCSPESTSRYVTR